MNTLSDKILLEINKQINLGSARKAWILISKRHNNVMMKTTSSVDVPSMNVLTDKTLVEICSQIDTGSTWKAWILTSKRHNNATPKVAKHHKIIHPQTGRR